MAEAQSVRNESVLEHALAHVDEGFDVFSVWSTLPDGTCRCVKGRACDSPGKHPIPPRGFLEATGNPARVRAMLDIASLPNYGMVWPLDSEVIVVILDVDGADWRERVSELKSQLGPLPPTKTTRTPSGGLHLFYRWPDGVPVPEGNKVHGFVARFPGKGYVVGPGSHINGRTYESVGPSEEMATLPLAWAVTGPVPGQQPLIVLADDPTGYALPERVEEGSRHDALRDYAGHLWNRNRDMSAEDGWGMAERELLPRFTSMSGHPASYYHDHFVGAWKDAERKWERREASPALVVVAAPDGAEEEPVVIDPLSVELHSETPAPLDIEALWLPKGLLGLVEHYRPISDAPFSSLVLASLCVFGALAGPKPTLRWRGDQRASVWGVLVGDSRWARKGQTIRVVRRAFSQVDALTFDIRKSGIASPEKFIALLNEAKSNTLGSLLIEEQELRSVITIASREGNNFSSILRQAWDGDDVSTHSMARGSISASGYHAAFLAGVSPPDLDRLPADDLANGWANRFLWFWSDGPRGDGAFDPVADDSLDPSLRDYLRECINRARALGSSSLLIAPRYTMSLDAPALARLEALFASLDVRPIGTIGILRQRMPDHVIRVALLSALLDQRSVVSLDDVTFGEAMAGYGVASMRAFFGARVDDEVGRYILDLLHQAPDGWLNTSTLSRLTHKEGSRVNTALRSLQGTGLVVREVRKTGGRPSIGYKLKRS